MAYIADWSTIPADNATADADMNWAEFMAPDKVNDNIRQLMARVKQWYMDQAGSVATTGTGNTYALAITSTLGASYPDGLTVWFTADKTNTGSSTLAVNGGAAVALRGKLSTALPPGSIISGGMYGAKYRLASNEFLLINSNAGPIELAPSLLTSNTFGLKVGDPLISLQPTPRSGFVRLTEATQALVKADYPDLNSWASGLGYPWGSAATTFNLPPAAGYFLRFAPTTTAVDPDGARAAGATQADAIKSHTHTATVASTVVNFAIGTSASVTVFAPGVAVQNPANGITVTNANNASGATETRPKNVAMHLDILAVPALVTQELVGAVGLAYSYSTDTSATDPAAGFLKFNNVALASATALYISETDGLGVGQAGTLAQWTSSTSTVRGVLTLVKVGNPAVTATFNVTGTVTDNGAWDTFTVAHLSSAGTLANLDKVHVRFARTGDKGDTGSGGGSGDVTAAAAFANDNRLIRSDGTAKGVQASGITVDDSDNVSGVTSVNDGPLAGLRNRLINGCMRLNVRAATTVADDSYCFDRWYVLTQTASVTIGSQSSIENGWPNAIRLTQSQAAAQRMGLAQIVEVTNAVDLRGQTVAFSARVRSSTAQTIRCAIIEWTGANNAMISDVVADWTSATYTAGNFFVSTTTTIAGVAATAVPANTPATIALAATISAAATNIAVFIWTEAACAQNVTLDIGKAQLENGPRATAFERRPLTTEQNLCARYYQLLPTWFGAWQEGSASMATISGTFLTPMRSTPTATLVTGTNAMVRPGTANYNATAIAVNALGTIGGYLDITTATAATGKAAMWTTNGTITLDSEL